MLWVHSASANYLGYVACFPMELRTDIDNLLDLPLVIQHNIQDETAGGKIELH